MSQHFPRIRFHDSYGTRVIRDGLRICFYMRRSSRQVAPAVMQVLETYLRAVGPQRMEWYLDIEGYWQLLSPETWEANRRHLLEATYPRVALTDDPSCASAVRFEYYGDGPDDDHADTDRDRVSAVGFWLPTEFLDEQGPRRLRELALELAMPLPFNSGHAGLCFNAIYGYHETEKELSRLCLRYPGIDMLAMEDLPSRLGTRLRGPAWMTFLGQPVLGELGGVDELRARLTSPGTAVNSLEGDRAVITLGPWPEAGDTEAGHLLPQYRELARVLEPWLYHLPGRYYFPDDIWDRWERRFLD